MTACSRKRRARRRGSQSRCCRTYWSARCCGCCGRSAASPDAMLGALVLATVAGDIDVARSGRVARREGVLQRLIDGAVAARERMADAPLPRDAPDRGPCDEGGHADDRQPEQIGAAATPFLRVQ